MSLLFKSANIVCCDLHWKYQSSEKLGFQIFCYKSRRRNEKSGIKDWSQPLTKEPAKSNLTDQMLASRNLAGLMSQGPNWWKAKTKEVMVEENSLTTRPLDGLEIIKITRRSNWLYAQITDINYSFIVQESQRWKNFCCKLSIWMRGENTKRILINTSAWTIETRYQWTR